MKPAIWCPMKSEAKAIEPAIRDSGISLSVSGIGRKKSLEWSTAFSAAASSHLGPLFIVGYGGALDSSLKTGQIFLAEEIIISSTQRKLLLGAAELLEKTGIQDVEVGAVYSSRRPVFSKNKRSHLNKLGARVVDMESWWLTENLPEDLLARTAIVRVISDTKAKDIFRTRKHLKIANEGLKKIGNALALKF